MPIPQFKDLKQCINYFQDEKVAWNFLETMIWKGKPVCPHCGSKRVYRLTNYKQFKCGNKKTCDRKFTVLVGSIFENTKVPLSTWFAALWVGTSHKKGISSVQLAKDLGITQKTAWYLWHRLRLLVTPKEAPELDIPDATVEVDTTFIKGRTKNKSNYERRLIAGGWKKEKEDIVMGLVQRGGKLILKVVPNEESVTLHHEIKTAVKDKQAIIVSDGHSSYIGLDMIYKGHMVIKHSEQEYVNGIYHTNTIESAFSLLKRGIYGIYHQ